MGTCVSPELIVTGQSIKSSIRLRHTAQRIALEPRYPITNDNTKEECYLPESTSKSQKLPPFFDCLMNTAENYIAKVRNINSLGTLVVFSSMRHRTYTYTLSTRSSFGILTSLRLGNLILEPAWRLDAFSAYPIRAQLPDSAVDTTIGSPEARHSRSSRTRECIPQISCAHSG